MFVSIQKKKNEKKLKKWEEEISQKEDNAGIIFQANSDDNDEKNPIKTKDEVSTINEKSKIIPTFEEDSENKHKSEYFEKIQQPKRKKYEWMSSSDEDISPEEDDNEQQSNEEDTSTKTDPTRRTIFVSNIDCTASNEDIVDCFLSYGEILSVDIPRNEGAEFNKGRAFIEYNKEKEADKAVAVSGRIKFGEKYMIIEKGIAPNSINIDVKEEGEEGTTRKKHKKHRSRSRSRSRDKEIDNQKHHQHSPHIDKRNKSSHYSK